MVLTNFNRTTRTFAPMEKLLADDLSALRLLMTEDLYKVAETHVPVPAAIIPETVVTQATEPEEPTVFSYLGENNKYFVILVNDQKHQHLNTTDKEALLKILQAKGMELRDVAIVNIHKHPGTTFSGLKNFFVPSRIVFFGLSAEQFGIPAISANQPGKFQEVHLLSTYSFDEMQSDVNKKKAFWQVMKTF